MRTLKELKGDSVSYLHFVTSPLTNTEIQLFRFAVEQNGSSHSLCEYNIFVHRSPSKHFMYSKMYKLNNFLGLSYKIRLKFLTLISSLQGAYTIRAY